jgi:hypothetical protein
MSARENGVGCFEGEGTLILYTQNFQEYPRYTKEVYGSRGRTIRTSVSHNWSCVNRDQLAVKSYHRLDNGGHQCDRRIV